jgi:hypothetical protein
VNPLEPAFEKIALHRQLTNPGVQLLDRLSRLPGLLYGLDRHQRDFPFIPGTYDFIDAQTPTCDLETVKTTLGD